MHTDPILNLFSVWCTIFYEQYLQLQQIFVIIIQCIFSFLYIGQELSMWPANNCLQIIIVLLQIIFYSCEIETTLLCENGRFVPQAVREWFDIFSWKELWSNDKTIIIIEICYRKILWFVSVSQINIICLISALGFGKWLICSPQTNHDILLNLAP